MRLADGFIGKDGKTLAPYINSSKIVEIIEIASPVEKVKRLDELNRALSKQTGPVIIIAFKK